MGGIVQSEDVLAYGDLADARVNGQVVEDLLASAEAFVQRYCRRQFVPEPALVGGEDTDDPVTKQFAVARNQRVVRIPDLRATASVVLNGSVLDTSFGYSPLDSWEPSTEIMLYEPYGQSAWVSSVGNGVLTVTGRWGWNPIPGDIRHAVLALTMRMWKERKASWSDSIALPDGSVLSYFRMLPASVQGTLDAYRTPHIGWMTLGAR